MEGAGKQAKQGQTDRQTRREASSPYSRRSTTAPSKGTPSRLSGILSSFLSPFRSTPKSSARAAAQASTVKEEASDGEEQHAQYAIGPLGGGDGSAGDELDGHAPPSPTPGSGRVYPSLSLEASRSILNPPSSSAVPTPRFPGNFQTSSEAHSPASFSQTPTTPLPRSIGTSTRWESAQSNGMDMFPPSRANEELARFFRDKAESNAPLTPIEQAGVLQLMQQVAQDEALPTAFTPSFRSSTPGPSFLSPSTSRRPASASGSSLSASTPAPLDAAFRRRRSIYVGAGYSAQSARRRKPTPSVFGSNEGLKRSQSESMVYEMAEGSEGSTVVEGKRRKVEEQEGGLCKSASVGSLAILAAPPVASLVPAPRAGPSALSSQKPVVATTPARPSPLWQVSKATTPSPSPPKKSTVSPPKAPTRAADLMMDIIRQEDAARPKVARQAVLNPYESSDNPIARIPRSRPVRAAATPKKAAAARVAAPKAVSPAKEISSLEMLERTMPAEYRRDEAKRARPTPPSPPSAAVVPTSAFSFTASPFAPSSPAPQVKAQTTPAPEAATPKPASAKKAIEVIELSDSSEGDELESEEEIKPVPKAVSAPQASRSHIRLPVSIAPPSLAPAPPTPSRPPPSTIPSSPSSLAPATVRPQPKASVPPTPPPVSAPFTFAVPPPAVVLAGSLSDAEAQKQALEMAESALPKFDFAGIVVAKGKRDDDAVLRGMRGLAREMHISELPVFTL